jgi:hypothetical protein
MGDIQELYKIVEYLTDKEKTQWVDLLHGIIIHLEEEEEMTTDSDAESESNDRDEFGCISEGVPEVNIDPNGFHSLV